MGSRPVANAWCSQRNDGGRDEVANVGDADLAGSYWISSNISDRRTTAPGDTASEVILTERERCAVNVPALATKYVSSAGVSVLLGLRSRSSLSAKIRRRLTFRLMTGRSLRGTAPHMRCGPQVVMPKDRGLSLRVRRLHSSVMRPRGPSEGVTVR